MFPVSIALLGCVLALAACPDAPPSPAAPNATPVESDDAGLGETEAGASDAGGPPADAGVSDDHDGGSEDAGRDVASSDAGGDAGLPPADSGTWRDDGGALDAGSPSPPADAGTHDAGVERDAGAAEDAGPAFSAPSGPYVLMSAPATSFFDETDVLQTNGAFAAEVRLGHVTQLRSAAFVIAWDPTLLELTSSAADTAWLTSGGGAPVVSADLDAASGRLSVLMGAAGPDAAVNSITSERVYRVELDWVASPASTEVVVDLAGGGLMLDGAAAPLMNVSSLPLRVSP
jgi:hypothetical protein